jgi:hypothetical protein
VRALLSSIVGPCSPESPRPQAAGGNRDGRKTKVPDIRSIQGAWEA